MLILAIGMIIFTVIRGVSQWNKNNQSPRLTVGAVVASKREDVTHHTHNAGNGAMHTFTDTSYFITFEFESGDRMELRAPSADYSELNEGDRGYLSFQGSRYLGFERI